MAMPNTDMKPRGKVYTLGWEREILYTSMQVVDTAQTVTLIMLHASEKYNA